MPQENMFISLRPTRLSIALFLVLNAVSLLALVIWGGIHQFSIVTFLFSVLFSFSFLSVLIDLLLLVSSKFFLIIILFIILTGIMIGLFVFQEFGVFIDENLLHFLVEDFQYLIDILTSTVTNNILTSFFIVLFIVLISWLTVYKIYH